MNTPITDRHASVIATGIREGEEVVDADLARRLELDRAELMEAVDALTLVIGLTPIKGNLEALQEAQDQARAALAAARANFP